MNTCQTCVYWEKEHSLCHKRFVDTPKDAEFKPNTMRVHVIANDGSVSVTGEGTRVYSVFTGPDFGCVHHKAKKSAEAQ